MDGAFNDMFLTLGAFAVVGIFVVGGIGYLIKKAVEKIAKAFWK